LFRQRKLL
jgi:hypothetical protein